MTEKDRIIDAILEIELQMFLTVNPMQTSGCQEDPESFKLHRRAQFAPWSEEALGSYLEDLHAAQAQGDNLMRRKYARMQGLLPPAESSPVLEEIVRLKMDWQRAMFRDYPTVMSGASAHGREHTGANDLLRDLRARRARNLLHPNPGTAPPGPAGDAGPRREPVGKGLRPHRSGERLRIAR